MRRWKLPPQRNESFHLSDKARRTAGEEEQEGGEGSEQMGMPNYGGGGFHFLVLLRLGLRQGTYLVCAVLERASE